MSVNIGNSWDELLKDEWDKDYYKKIREVLITIIKIIEYILI